MAPYDPYADVAEPPSVHQRLVTLLAQHDSPDPVDSSPGPFSGITTLPKEIFEHVVSYVTSKRDLAQLCKTNRRSFAAALPLLYRSIPITIEEVLEPVLLQMLTRDNTGLRYVKEVIVYSDRSPCRSPRNAHQGLDVLINQIPKDALSSFCWRTPHQFPRRLLTLLWKKQRNLENLEIFAPYIHDSWNRDGELAEVDSLAELNRIDFPSLRIVRTVPDSPETAILACAALKREGVTSLEVDGRLWQNGDARVIEEDDNDSEQRVEDQLTECLFSHVTPIALGQIPNCTSLTTLILKDVNLTLCKRTWLTYLDLCHLKNLRLEYCTGADIFLMQAASGAATPGLRSFHVLHDLGTQADRTVHAIEELLSSPRHKVEDLQLVLRNAQRLPSPASIRGHSKSLRTLLLDIETKPVADVQVTAWAQPPSSPRPSRLQSIALTYSTSEFQSLVESCSSLVELGIALPSVTLYYEVLSEECAVFHQCIDVIASNLNLTTLNIVNWPRKYRCGQSTGYYKTKNLQLARLASDIFRHHRCYDPTEGRFVKRERHCTLEIIAFGVLESGNETPPPAYFVQCELSILSKKSIYAQEVDMKYLLDQALDVGILDYEERDFDEPLARTLASHMGGIVAQTIVMLGGISGMRMDGVVRRQYGR